MVLALPVLVVDHPLLLFCSPLALHNTHPQFTYPHFLMAQTWCR